MKRFFLITFSLLVLALLYVGYRYVYPHVQEHYWPKKYVNVDDRLTAAKRFCKANKLRTDYCVFVDFSIPSRQPRFFIYDLNDHSIVHQGRVAHGCGKPSTADKPAFSNGFGSKLSSLGRFTIEGRGKSKRLGDYYALSGYDWFINHNAGLRGIYIHSARMVTRYERNRIDENLPMSNISEGCFTVSRPTLERLMELRKGNRKPMLLWAYH